MFDVGAIVPLTAEIYDGAGALTSASGVVCTVGLPDGTTATPTVANPSTGRYTVDYVATMPGRHTERWTSNVPATARTDVFDVRPSAASYLMSLADAKDHLNKSGAATIDDDELRDWMAVCTEVVEELARQVVVPRTVVEIVQLDHYRSRFALTHTPVMSLTSFTTLDGDTARSTVGAYVNPTSGVVMLTGGPSLRGPIQVTYRAGAAVIPSRYVGAAKMILKHLWSSQRVAVGGSRRGIGGSSSTTIEETIMVAGWAVPKAAAELVGPRPPLVL